MVHASCAVCFLNTCRCGRYEGRWDPLVWSDKREGRGWGHLGSDHLLEISFMEICDNFENMFIPPRRRCCHSLHHQHREFQILNHPHQCHSWLRLEQISSLSKTSTCKQTILGTNPVMSVSVSAISGTSCYCDQCQWSPCLYQAPESWHREEGGRSRSRSRGGSIRARYQWLSVRPGPAQTRASTATLASRHSATQGEWDKYSDHLWPPTDLINI